MLCQASWVQWSLLVYIGLAGCSTPQIGPPELIGARLSSTVQFGPEFEVLDRQAHAVAAIVGPDDLAHLLVVTDKPRDVYHLVVGPTGVAKQQRVMQTVSADSLAVAFDDEGLLRAVIGDQHIVLRSDGWSAPEQGPPCERLVRAGKTLVCAYRMTGGKEGASWRADWFLPVPLPVPVPYPVMNRQLLLDCRTSSGWSTWAVLDPNANHDVEQFAIAGDDTGSLQILYRWTRSMPMGLVDGRASARVPALANCGALAPGDKSLEVVGHNLVETEGLTFDIAVDPRSGASLNIVGTWPDSRFASFVRQGDSIGTASLLEARDLWRLPRVSGPVHIAPAGQDQFHVLVNLSVGTFNVVNTWYHLIYFNGSWSAPSEVAQTKGQAWGRLVHLVSGGSTRALAILPNADPPHIKGRWVELTR